MKRSIQEHFQIAFVTLSNIYNTSLFGDVTELFEIYSLFIVSDDIAKQYIQNKAANENCGLRKNETLKKKMSGYKGKPQQHDKDVCKPKPKYNGGKLFFGNYKHIHTHSLSKSGGYDVIRCIPSQLTFSGLLDKNIRNSLLTVS